MKTTPARPVLILASLLILAPVLPAAEPPGNPAVANENKKGIRNVGVEAFDAMRKGTNVVVLDVRTAAEFSEGHLPNAINLDFYAPDFAQQLGKLDRNKTYLVHCAVGGRSARACTTMGQLNFTNTVNLEGGYKAWTKAGKMVVGPPGQ